MSGCLEELEAAGLEHVRAIQQHHSDFRTQFQMSGTALIVFGTTLNLPIVLGEKLQIPQECIDILVLYNSSTSESSCNDIFGLSE